MRAGGDGVARGEAQLGGGAKVARFQWQLQVRDTGRGIMEENFETIFDEFRQEMRTSQEPGTGLGLAITRNLVLMMRGTIGLQSEVGKGSTFTVTLPLKPATVAEAEQPVEA